MPFFTFTNSTCLDWFWQQKKFVASSTGSQSVPFQLSALNRISSLNISQRKQSSCFSWQRKLGIFDSRRSYHNKSNYTISGAQRTNRMINKSFSQNNRLIKNFKYLFSPEQISGFLLAEKPKFLKAPSKFAIKLRESRKIRSFYGNLSLNYFKKIIKKSNYGSVYQKNDSILTLLESRLDVVLYRSGFFESIATAKQWIFAFGVYINQKKVSSPAVLVLPGDIISLLPSTRIRKQNQSSNNLLSYNDARIMNAAVASAKLMQASAKPMQNLDIQYKNKASTHFSAINYFAFFEVAPRILHNFVTQIANIRKADLSMVLPSLANFALILRCKIMQNHAKPRNKELFFGVRFIEKLAALYAKREAFRFFVDGQVSSTQWGVQQEWEKQLPQNRYSNSKANSRTAAQSKIRLSMRNISKMGSITKIGYTNKVDVQVDEKAEIQSNIHTDIIPYYRERSGVLHLSEFSFRVEQMTCFISSFYKFDKQIESLSPTLPNDKFSQFKRKQKKWRFKATAFRVALQRSSLKTFSKQSKKSVIFAKEWIENRFYKTNNKNVKLKHTNIVETLLSSKKYWLSPSQAFSFFNRDIKSEDFSHSLFLQFDLGLQDTLKFKRKEKSFLQHQESILGQHELSHDGASQFKNQEKNSKLSTISAPKDNCLYAFVFLNYTLFLKKQLLYLTAKKCKVAKGKKRQNIKFHDDNTATTSFSKQIPNQNQRTNKKERLFRLKVLPFYSETTEKQKAICFEKQKDISFFKGQHFFVSKKAKPLHLEISYKSLSVVFLFNPQRICFPFFINVSHIYK